MFVFVITFSTEHFFHFSRTVRLWDVDNEYRQRVVIKTKNQQGRKTNATACTYSRDGRYLAVACQDGSIQLWDCNRKFVSINSSNQVFLFFYFT